MARTKKSATYTRIVREVRYGSVRESGKSRVELQAIYRKPAPGAPGRRAAVPEGQRKRGGKR